LFTLEKFVKHGLQSVLISTTNRNRIAVTPGRSSVY